MDERNWLIYDENWKFCCSSNAANEEKALEDFPPNFHAVQDNSNPGNCANQ